eukprot:scpid41718/ scgid8803/ 
MPNMAVSTHILPSIISRQLSACTLASLVFLLTSHDDSVESSLSSATAAASASEPALPLRGLAASCSRPEQHLARARSRMPCIASRNIAGRRSLTMMKRRQRSESSKYSKNFKFGQHYDHVLRTDTVLYDHTA